MLRLGGDAIRLGPAFAFDMSAFGTQYLSFEALEKTGTSEVILGGATTDVRDFSVRGGTARVDASMPGFAVEVAPRAALSGAGTIGTLRIAGTVAPGGVGIDTLRVAGDADFADGSRLEIDVGAEDVADLLAVAGAAMVSEAGTVLVVSGLPGAAKPSDGVAVLTAAGGLTGRFATVADDLPDVDVVAVYDPSALRLAYVTADVPQPPPSLPPSFAQPAPGLSAKEIVPAIGASALEIAQGFTAATSTFGGRPAGARGKEASGDRGPHAGIARRITTASSRGAARAPPSVTLAFGGFGAARDVEDQGGGPELRRGYATRGKGVWVGAGGWVATGGGTLTWAATIGRSHSRVDARDARADLDGLHIGAVGTVRRGGLTISSAATAARLSVGSERMTGPLSSPVFARLEADAATLALRVDASWDLLAARRGQSMLEPTFGLEVTRARVDGATETGAGALGLAIADRTFVRGAVRLGLRAGTEVALGRTMLAPSLALGYERLVGPAEATGSATLALTGTRFAVDLAPVERDRATLALGLAARSGRVDFGLRYDGAFGRRSRDHVLSAGVSIAF